MFVFTGLQLIHACAFCKLDAFVYPISNIDVAKEKINLCVASPRMRRESSLCRVDCSRTQTEFLYRVCFYRTLLVCIDKLQTKSLSMGVMGGERFAFLGFPSKRLFLFFFAYLCQLLKNMFKAHNCLHHSICSNHVTSTFNSKFLLNSMR